MTEAEHRAMAEALAKAKREAPWLDKPDPYAPDEIDRFLDDLDEWLNADDGGPDVIDPREL